MNVNELKNEKKSEILELFVPICDESRKIEREIANKGLKCFCLIQEFEESFCDDGVSHYKYMQEIGKEFVGSFDGGMATFIGEHHLGYRSPYLTALTTKRDLKNGMDFQSFQKTLPGTWELELDECKKRRERYRKNNPVEFLQKKKDFDDRVKFEKDLEMRNRVEEYRAINEYTAIDKIKISNGILSKYLGEIGLLEMDSKRSDYNPIYCLEFSEEFYLSCMIKNQSNLVDNAERGAIDLVFHLRSKRFMGPTVEVSPFRTPKHSEKYLVMNAKAVVPYYSDAYSRFSSMAEIELNVIAQVLIFDLVFSRVKNSIRELL